MSAWLGWVHAVIVADFAHQFLFFCLRVPILHHRVTSAKVLVLQKRLHCVQKAHDVVLVFEDALFCQLLSFIGSDNVTDEATDAIQHNMQPLLCCQVVLCPKNAMPVTEVSLCIWVM